MGKGKTQEKGGTVGNRPPEERFWEGQPERVREAALVPYRTAVKEKT
jgi:hypothetical protein